TVRQELGRLGQALIQEEVRVAPIELGGDAAFVISRRSEDWSYVVEARERRTGRLLWAKPAPQAGQVGELPVAVRPGLRAVKRTANPGGQIVLVSGAKGEERELYRMNNGYIGDPCFFDQSGRTLVAFQTADFNEVITVRVCDLNGKSVLRHAPTRSIMVGFG